MNFWQRILAHPVGMIGIPLGVTTIAVLGYKFAISPILTRRKYGRNEQWAEILYELEEKKTKDSE